MIPVAELYGFPLTDQGPAAGLRNIYHYKLVDGQFQKVLCEKCTFSDQFCAERQAAEDLVMPEGDK
jgi:hypothetical protein